MAFLGINIAIGMMYLPQVSDYWSTNKILATPWLSSIMARDHFYTLLRYLHLVAEKKGEYGYDALFKVRFFS